MGTIEGWQTRRRTKAQQEEFIIAAYNHGFAEGYKKGVAEASNPVSAWRALGNRTPQVAFLTPFGNPAKVTRELWRDLYQPGVHPELWFRWEGKPLILADPDLLEPKVEQTRQTVS